MQRTGPACCLGAARTCWSSAQAGVAANIACALSSAEAVAAVTLMSPVLTLVADRTATSLTDATIARVCEAAGGGTPVVLSVGEAADILLPAAPDMDAVRAALESAAIDAIPIPPDFGASGC